MQVKTSYRGNVLIVKPEGELDHHTAETFKSVMVEELEQGIARNIVLDLSGLTFMDSSGLGVLLGRYKQLSQWQGKMLAFGLQPAVHKVYLLSGLPKLIPLGEDLQSCLSVLGG